MQVQVKVPAEVPSGLGATVTRWFVEAGRSVTQGEPLYELETDKAVLQVEAPAGGVLQQVLVEPGRQVKAGQVVAVIETRVRGSG